MQKIINCILNCLLFNAFGKYNIRIGHRKIIYLVCGLIKKNKKERVRKIISLLFSLKNLFEKRVYPKNGSMSINERQTTKEKDSK